MIRDTSKDLYRSYRAVDSDQGGDVAARLFAEHHLVPRLAPFREEPILEIGAGTGGTLRALRAAGFGRLVGVDTSASQVERARALGTELELVDGLAALEVRAPASLGAVLLLDVLEHLPLSNLIRLLELAADRLRPGGVLIARVPNGEGLFGAAILHGDLTHLRAFTSRSVVQAFTLGGLEVEAICPVRPLVHGLPSALRAVTWRLVELLLKLASMAEAGHPNLVVTRNLLAVARKGA